MRTQIGTDISKRKFLDIPTAAQFAGFSSRHFRRIIEEDHIPVMQIGRKMFIVASDLEMWKSTYGETRLQAALQQVDGWINDNAARARIFEQSSVRADN